MKILTPNLVLESAHRRGFRWTATKGDHNSRGGGGGPGACSTGHFLFHRRLQVSSSDI